MLSTREVRSKFAARLQLISLFILLTCGFTKCAETIPLNSAVSHVEGKLKLQPLPLPTELDSKNINVPPSIEKNNVKGKHQYNENELTTHVTPNNSSENVLTRSKPMPIRDQDEIVLEGGGRLTTSSNNGFDNASMVGERHQTGSKGRKGVKYPGSSVVARKGVEPQQLFNISSITISTSPTFQTTEDNSAVHTLRPSDKFESEVDLKHLQSELAFTNKSMAKSQHAKKPEAVFDAGDTDDFDKYPIIKSSTTGEDYVIIGIVIVIGIWFSVFGALIFYRRAGEYWDRRHYRRMDFLVEGMYND